MYLEQKCSLWLNLCPSKSILTFFAVSAQSQRDQNQEGSGPVAEPHQVLPCTVQVRHTPCLD